MPIRAYCTICSDFFDHSRDVAAIHCGHTFHYECLLQWFQTAPTKTCPQCRKQVSTRHIISKLFFDVNADEEGPVDAESLQNELDRVRALLSTKERDWRDKQKVIDGLKDTVDKQRNDLDRVRKETSEKEMLCSALKKQMTYLETQQNDVQAAKDEVRRLRMKMKTFESLEVLLQGRRAEVESMITDMGVSQAAVEQLSIYCISLKKEYDNLKGTLKSSNELCEKLKREVLSSNGKLQKATVETNQSKEDMKSLQKDLANADREISSLKKKVELLQKTLVTPTRTNEALSRLIFESPAPANLTQPRLHQPADSEGIDLNVTYDVSTPVNACKRRGPAPSKKMCLDPPATSGSKPAEKSSSLSKARDEDPAMDSFLRNSLLFRKKTFGTMLDPHRKPGTVRTGYDGLGGRTKFIQPSPLSEIRPLIKAKRKKVARPPSKGTTCLTLDGFLGRSDLCGE
ncbi:E3 ubiquitin-protein ligase TRAIP [Cololabis saira]|uniref:E3 ubiquitin-protein ligase TRAIP n=1 Tax=Cololabis saira TaxID=129043 RepID=UPI002AD2C364|nr:E3 ubiquitin-protein ligase TRAIP [Cololabis saira]